ncbi:MAG: hypothetical protein M0R17_05775 [Candidatus Omnitrophica bacterium]|nr:hypothetical protein [Candidatus Omnitrophota bacterium]
MIDRQRELIIYLLKELSDRYSNDGCNDLNEEEEQFIRDLDIEVEIDDNGFKMCKPTQNSQLIQYIIKILEEEKIREKK